LIETFGVYISIIAIYENKIINHVSGNSILQDLENILICLDRNKNILKTNIIHFYRNMVQNLMNIIFEIYANNLLGCLQLFHDR